LLIAKLAEFSARLASQGNATNGYSKLSAAAAGGKSSVDDWIAFHEPKINL